MNPFFRSLAALPIGGIGRRPDILLACAVTFIVAILIIPLPGFLLDIFVSLNITVSVVVLMSALFIRRSLDLTSFPSLLLVTTLFRLGLNISTTRGILAHADAGEVVKSFGRFILQGDLIVGMVIFLVVTLVQFLVIAKGAERVAEVGARFTLDAMPGKQMSIDAAVRQGAITDEEAETRRSDLGRQSQMFGNMDGAMKFVKGDAIAGLMITALNLVAGFAIGVVRNDMELAEAAEVYSTLTVGDGLVSQISALLITLAAGVIVTRVDSEDGTSSLGFIIRAEIFRTPTALTLAAVLLFGLAVVPGLPFVPFATLGSLMLAIGKGREFYARSVEARALATPEGRRANLERKLKEKVEIAKGEKFAADRMPPSVTPIGIELDAKLSVAVGLGDNSAGDATSELVESYVPQLREALFNETGIRFPGVRVRPNTHGLPAGGFVIRIKEVPALKGVIRCDRHLAMAPPEALNKLGVTAEATRDPVNGTAAALITEEQKAVVQASGISVWSPAGIVALSLAGVLRKRAKEFIGLQETSELVDRLEKAYPALIREVVPKVISLAQIADVLRRLADERVSIRDMKTIVEALGEHAAYENNGVSLTEKVRAALSTQLAHAHARNDNRIYAVMLEPAIEDTIAAGLHTTAKGTVLTLEPEISVEIIDAMTRALNPLIARGLRPVVLTVVDVRRYVRRLLEGTLPQVAVLSYEELPSDLIVQPMGRASLDAGEARAA